MSGADYPVKRSPSPWGEVEHAYEIAPGIVRVGTPSHGGIWLSAQRIAHLPAWALAVGSGYAPKPYWWEEDCEAVVPLYVFSIDCAPRVRIPTLSDVILHMQHSRKMLELLSQHPALNTPDGETARERIAQILSTPSHPRQLAGGAS